MNQSNDTAVLIVSKPLVPPWNDSSKNLAMGIVTHARQTGFHVLTTPGYPLPAPGVVSEPVYRTAGDYSPSLFQNVRVLRRLARPDRNIGIYHFFFAPNPLTSSVCRWIMRLKKQATIQTVCSPPRDYDNLSRLIFTDFTVVLSDYHLNIFRREGIKNVIRIYPGVEIPEKISLPENPLRERLGITDEKVLLYPGDYEFSRGHEIILEILPRLVKESPRLKLLFACRPKTPASVKIEAAVKQRLREMGCGSRVVFLGHVDRMAELYDLTTICLFPVRSLYKKMDLPLTLLECLAWGIPVIASDIPPLNEMVNGRGGRAVRPDDPGDVTAAVRSFLSNPALTREYGENGRKLAREKFDIVKTAEHYETLYKKMEEAR